MVLFVAVNVKEVGRLGKAFPWPRPRRCPRCRGRIWGHGFVLAYFEGVAEEVFLRRYRCPDCRSVYRLRPRSHWRRLQSSIETIRRCLEHRIKSGSWCRDGPRSRQGHWLRGLRIQSAIHLGLCFSVSLLDAFDSLVERGLVAVSRCVKSEMITASC